MVPLKINLRFSGCTRRYSPCAEEGLRFLYHFKRKPVVNGTHTALSTLRCMDTPTEAVIPVVGDNMRVVLVIDDVARFCKSEGIYCVASATDGGGS